MPRGSELSQAELAERMNTNQSAIVRLQSGRSSPSTRALRRVAETSGWRLRIYFEPEDDKEAP